MTAVERTSQTGVLDGTRPGTGLDYTCFLLCVHCGLCTSSCPTYLETADENDSPRGRIYLMRAIADGRLEPTEKVQRHLQLCLDCRACETACPSGVQYGRLLEPFRLQLEAWKARRGEPSLSGLERVVLFELFPKPARLRWALLPARVLQLLRLDRVLEWTGAVSLLPPLLQRMYRLLPRLRRQPPALPTVLPAEGRRRARVALFTGCVADVLFRHVHWATARVLQRNGCEVVVPRTQVCCGAIHYHNGEGQAALELARQNAEALLAEQTDAVVVNVAGCGAMLKEYPHLAVDVSARPDDRDLLNRLAERVRDVHEFLVELGFERPEGPLPLRVVYDDACHLAHAQRVTSPPRQLLASVPELEVLDLPESDVCCGAAGSYNLTEPEMADRLGKRKAEQILESGAQAVVTANAGCALQIQAALREAGRPLWVAHPVELLDLSYRKQPPPVPSGSSS